MLLRKMSMLRVQLGILCDRMKVLSVLPAKSAVGSRPSARVKAAVERERAILAKLPAEGPKASRNRN